MGCGCRCSATSATPVRVRPCSRVVGEVVPNARAAAVRAPVLARRGVPRGGVPCCVEGRFAARGAPAGVRKLPRARETSTAPHCASPCLDVPQRARAKLHQPSSRVRAHVMGCPVGASRFRTPPTRARAHAPVTGCGAAFRGFADNARRVFGVRSVRAPATPRAHPERDRRHRRPQQPQQRRRPRRPPSTRALPRCVPRGPGGGAPARAGVRGLLPRAATAPRVAPDAGAGAHRRCRVDRRAPRRDPARARGAAPVDLRRPMP